MSLRERLIEQSPRDLSGSRSSDRFVFQQTWALCKILLLHQGSTDYVVVLDHHEDVMILDAENEPFKIEAFQVKTASSNWTVNSLLKREPGKGKPPNLLPSILGKLYDLKKRLPDDVKLLQFVSNTSVSVKLKKDGKTHRDAQHTQFADLDGTEANAISSKLKDEHGLSQQPDLDGILEFAVSEIPVKEHATHGAGRLAEFLDVLFPKKQFSTVPLYKALLSEVALRNNNQRQIASFDDLIVHKSISRSSFNRILSSVGVTSAQTTWQEVGDRLNVEGMPISELTALKKEWDTVVLDRVSRRDLQYTQFSSLIARARRGKDFQKLKDGVANIYAEVSSKLRKEWDFPDAYIKSAIALEIYEPSERKDASSDIAEGKE